MFLQRLAKINTRDRHLKLVLDHHIKHFCAVKDDRYSLFHQISLNILRLQVKLFPKMNYY